MREGVVDGCVFDKLGAHYHQTYALYTDMPTAIKFHQQAVDAGYTLAYKEIYDLEDYKNWERPLEQDKALVALLETIEKKSDVKWDERLLTWLLRVVGHREIASDPASPFFARFKTKMELILHCCNLFIRMGSSLAYTEKADFCYQERHNLCDTLRKTDIDVVTVCEEADRLGLACPLEYIHLQFAHR